MAERFKCPYLGKLPLDKNLLKACEEGSSFVENYPESPAASPLNKIVDSLILALPVEDDIDDVAMEGSGDNT